MKRSFAWFLAFWSNLLLVLAMYVIGWLVFVCCNHSLFPGLSFTDYLFRFLNSLRFDWVPILYANLPLVLLMLLPTPLREMKACRIIAQTFFVLLNSVCLLTYLCDVVYFPYTGRITTWAIFEEFKNDDISGIFLREGLTHFYLVLLFVGIVFLLWKGFRQPASSREAYRWPHFAGGVLCLLLTIAATLIGIRGSFSIIRRPLEINDATLYIGKPVEAGLVLNTPFCMMRSIDAQPFVRPDWYTEEELESVTSPIHLPRKNAIPRYDNVVIFILESFSASYSALLTQMQGTPCAGYMPFLDSLMQESLLFRHSYANGRVSVDALPAIYCGIPSLIDSFILTPYNQNDLGSLALCLSEKGYSTAFFQGSAPESMGLAPFSRKVGFAQTFSLDDYPDQERDMGNWGIWDDPYLQYCCNKIGEFREPFLATVFTLTSHNPWILPPDCVYEEGSLPVHPTIRYVDDAVRHFFEKARKEPWFERTLFVFTGDHTNMTDVPEYKTPNGLFTIPLFFYHPDGSIKGRREGVAQQIDICPTVLSYLGYDRPSFSFGNDLLTTADEDTYAVQCLNGVYQYCQNGWILLFDGQRSVGLYHYGEDPLLQANQLNAQPMLREKMEGSLKALIQQFISRMMDNRLTVEDAGVQKF